MAATQMSAKSVIQAPTARASFGGNVRGLKALTVRAPTRTVANKKTVCMAAVTADEVPDMNKRVVMNWLLVGAAGLPTVGMAIPYLYYFVPKGAGGAGGSQIAKDALGNDITLASWTKTHLAGDRSLAQGLKGDPTYLIVKDDGSIESYGLNAVCTHLGCVVPWVAAENKFKCPCHGSQYDFTGKVVRGPAPLSLALTHCETNEETGAVSFSPWTETDFRTNTDPWWS